MTKTVHDKGRARIKVAYNLPVPLLFILWGKYIISQSVMQPKVCNTDFILNWGHEYEATVCQYMFNIFLNSNTFHLLVWCRMNHLTLLIARIIKYSIIKEVHSITYLWTGWWANLSAWGRGTGTEQEKIRERSEKNSYQGVHLCITHLQTFFTLIQQK